MSEAIKGEIIKILPGKFGIIYFILKEQDKTNGKEIHYFFTTGWLYPQMDKTATVESEGYNMSAPSEWTEVKKVEKVAIKKMS